MPSILTIHNLAYQGLFERERLPALGIPENAFQIDGVEFYVKLSFLKAGIFYASHVTTVSSTYAQEITNRELGCGLDGLLRASLRSLLFGWALRKALVWRVSMQTAGSPAAARPLNSH